MPENTAPAPNATQPPDERGRPFYESERTKLKRLLHQKRELERQLQITEETIYKKEYEYLEDTPQGNIITGFDGYTKGSTGTQAGGRRRGPMVDMNRVFTRSSITYRQDLESPAPTAQSTPVAAMAPTPLSTSFVKGDGGSNHATPTSASSASRTGAGGVNSKKNKKGDDSGDEKDVKKIRTNFGAARK